jgi:hypothetical protein
VPVAALVAGAGLVFHLARKWARKPPPPTLTPASGDAKSTGAKPETPGAYDARIDEELRGLDE